MAEIKDNNSADNPQNIGKDKIGRNFWDLLYSLGDFFDDLTNIREGMDREGTIAYIKNNKRMRGANVWLLICSIMVASIGLDLNSPAVIIGAMLISPLMSPILGVGLGVGINDRETLFISLQHFGISIGLALLTSIIYFSITPLGEVTNEIDARTSPTFLDAMVAIFGGLAGIVSTTRKESSNAIPGVAIATALMPPLCVSGYGIATGNFQIFLNSFYLFFLNSVFIALTTYLIVRFLKFPYKKYMSSKERFRNSIFIVTFSVIIIVPSAMILYNVWTELKYKQNITTFIRENFNDKGYQSLDWKLYDHDSIRYIKVDYYQNENDTTFLSEANMNNKLVNAGMRNTRLMLNPTKNIIDALEKRKENLNSNTETRFSEEMAKYQEEQVAKENEIKRLNSTIDSLITSIDIASLTKEAKIWMPNLKTFDIGKSMISKYPLLIYEWNEEKPKPEDLDRLYNFVKLRTELDTLVFYSDL